MQRQCPDCAVTMEPVEFRMYDAKNPKVKTGDSREGVLGKLGVGERKRVETVACPECGLLRHYIDPDG